MARLLTCGFETQRINTTALTTVEGEGTIFTGTPTIDATVPRSGAACLACATGATRYLSVPLTYPLDSTNYVRLAVRRAGAITTNTDVFEILVSTVLSLGVRWNTSGQLTLVDANGTAQGSTLATSTNTWYVVEVKFVIPTASSGTVSLRVDGVDISTDVAMDVNNSFGNQTRFGTSASSGTTIYVDDVAVNDTTGANQNSWCGHDGKIILLKPTVLGSGGRGNWTAGGGGTTNLHEDVNNTPPTGTATGAAGTQIKNASSTVPSSAEFDCETYTAGGVGGSDEVRLVQGLWRTSAQTITSTNPGTARLFGNPDVGSDTTINFEGSTAAAGTDPAGWRTETSGYVYAPSVTKGNPPQIRITKTTAATRVHQCDLMGVYVEYGPAPPPPEIAPHIRGTKVGPPSSIGDSYVM